MNETVDDSVWCEVREVHVNLNLYGSGKLKIEEEYCLLFFPVQSTNEFTQLKFMKSDITFVEYTNDSITVKVIYKGRPSQIQMRKMGKSDDSTWGLICVLLHSCVPSISSLNSSINDDILESSPIPTSSLSSNIKSSNFSSARPLPPSMTSSLSQRHFEVSQSKDGKRQKSDLSKESAKLGAQIDSILDRKDHIQKKSAVDLAPPSQSLVKSLVGGAYGTIGDKFGIRGRGHNLAPYQNNQNNQNQNGQLVISYEQKESPMKGHSATYSSFRSQSDPLSSPLSTSQHMVQTEYTGIRNTGNTCYINAVLQGLMSLGSFVSDIGRDQLTDLTRDIDLRSFYRAFLAIADQTLEKGRKTALDPSRVKLAIARYSERFRDNEQQDAHEFLISCLSQLEADLMPFLNLARRKQQESQISSFKSSSSKFHKKSSSNMIEEEEEDDDDDDDILEAPSSHHPSEIGPGIDDGIPFSQRITMLDPSKRNFAGVLKSSLTCDGCGDESFNYESIRCLTLDVFETPDQIIDHIISNLRGPSNLPLDNESSIKNDLLKKYHAPATIDQLLSIYFSPEKIERRCEKCDCKVSTIARQFSQIPRILVIHLKRFSYNFQTGQYSKLQCPIEVSKDIDLSSFSSPGPSCAGPIPFQNDGSGTILRSRSRIQALPKEEQTLKDMLKKDRAAKKRKRSFPSKSSIFDGDDDSDHVIHSEEEEEEEEKNSSSSKPSLPSHNHHLHTRTEISDSSTSLSFHNRRSNDHQSSSDDKSSKISVIPSSRGNNHHISSTSSNHHPSSIFIDENSPEYQLRLNSALDSFSSSSSSLHPLHPLSLHSKMDLSYDEEADLDIVDSHLPPSKKQKTKTPSSLSDSSDELDLEIALHTSQTPSSYRQPSILASDHRSDANTDDFDEISSSPSNPAIYSIDSLPDSFTDDFKGAPFYGSSKGGMEREEKSGSKSSSKFDYLNDSKRHSHSSKTSVKPWIPDRRRDGGNGFGKGGGLKGGSGPGGGRRNLGNLGLNDDDIDDDIDDTFNFHHGKGVNASSRMREGKGRDLKEDEKKTKKRVGRSIDNALAALDDYNDDDDDDENGTSRNHGNEDNGGNIDIDVGLDDDVGGKINLNAPQYEPSMTVDLTKLSQKDIAMWEAACEYVMSDNDEGRSFVDSLQTPLPSLHSPYPPMPSSLDSSSSSSTTAASASSSLKSNQNNNAMASGSFSTASSRANISSSSSSSNNNNNNNNKQLLQNSSSSNSKPPMSQRSAILSGNTYTRPPISSSSFSSSKPISLDDIDDHDDDDMAKAVAASKADYDQIEREKKMKDEENLQRALEASKRDSAARPNDYDMDGLFDSGDEGQLSSGMYVKDEYEGDEVAPLSSDSQGPIPSSDPQRPPISFQYSLQSIVHHIGISANSGHYVADVKSNSSSSSTSNSSSNQKIDHNSWKTFDDAKVTPTSEDIVFSKTTSPYLLFYVCQSISS